MQVDDEFLAMYQANYGIHNTAGPDAEDTFAVPALPARVGECETNFVWVIFYCVQALRNVQPPKADLTSDGKGKAGGVESDHVSERYKGLVRYCANVPLPKADLPSDPEGGLGAVKRDHVSKGSQLAMSVSVTLHFSQLDQRRLEQRRRPKESSVCLRQPLPKNQVPSWRQAFWWSKYFSKYIVLQIKCTLH